jgi:hypothetical protein
MKRLAAVGAAGVDRALSGPVVHTGAGAAPAGKVAEKRGPPKPDGPLYLDGISARDRKRVVCRRFQSAQKQDLQRAPPQRAPQSQTSSCKRTPSLFLCNFLDKDRLISKFRCGPRRVTCHRSFIQQQLESRGYVRHAARVEQRAIGGAGRGCAADRPLR